MEYKKAASEKSDYMVEIRSLSPSLSSPAASRSSFSSYDEKDGLLDRGEDDHGNYTAPARRTLTQLANGLWILVNTFSTVAIVFLNKRVFSDPQLRDCQFTVATWHFTATFLLLFLSTRWPFHFFSAKRIPLSSSIPLSTLFAGFLILGNLSLAWNPVGFYQLSKVLNTPAVVLLGWLVLRRSVSRPVLASVSTVCIGVTLTNAHLALSNPAGTAVALAAVCVTALYQVWIASRIEVLAVGAPQLLLNQSAVSVLLLVLLAPFLDRRPDFATVPSSTLAALLASGVLAACLNLSQFQVIARTSALTFNIVSNLKTILIVSISWSAEQHVLSPRDIVGVLLALSGAYAYAHSTQKAKAST